MVSQLHWEDDVVWNGEDIKQKVASHFYNPSQVFDYFVSTCNSIFPFFEPYCFRSIKNSILSHLRPAGYQVGVIELLLKLSASQARVFHRSWVLETDLVLPS